MWKIIVLVVSFTERFRKNMYQKAKSHTLFFFKDNISLKSASKKHYLLSFPFSNDFHFDIGQILAFPFTGNIEPLNFSKMGFQPFCIFIEIQRFIILNGFESLLILKKRNHSKNIVNFFILHLKVVVLDGIRSILNLGLDAF